MAKGIEGTYRAKLLPFTFEKVGAKESPMMKANFQPIGQVVDKEVKIEENLPKVNKGYFLGLEIISEGKYTGKSKMEAIKIQLAEGFGYTGPFDPEKLNEFAASGKDVDIVCELNDAGYTNVKFVNPPGGGKKGGKVGKAMSGDEIASFAKGWDTGTNAAPVQDAASLFAQLTSEQKPDGK